MTAARLLFKRWPFYLMVCALVYGAEYLFYQYVHLAHASIYAELIGTPIIATVVFVNAGFDASEPAISGRLERTIERAWAVIVLEAALTMLSQAGIVSVASADPAGSFAGIFVMFFGAMLVYAEPFAALEPSVETLTILPFAVVRSLMLSWVNMSRVFSLFAVQIAVAAAEMLLLRAVSPKGGGREFDLVDLGFVALVTAPLCTLYVVAYLDTLAQEQARKDAAG